MRRILILVESARRKNRFRDGGDLVRVDFDEFNTEAPEAREDLLALDAALTKRKLVDGTASELVQLRYFAGLTQAEAAEILDISPRTADRIWAYSRAWLHREVQQTGEVWQTESFDHLIRSPEQFERFQSYIAENGREAGLGDGVYLHWRRPM